VSTMAREYKQAYNKAKQELLERLKKRDQLDQEIRKLKQSTKTLAELAGANPEEVDKLLLAEGFAFDPRLGFTDAIRRLLRIHREALHPIEIRDDLLKMGIGRDQVNLLSSIHTVLRRLVAAGEIEKTVDSRFRLAI
jgi:hypothetical protein